MSLSHEPSDAELKELARDRAKKRKETVAHLSTLIILAKEPTKKNGSPEGSIDHPSDRIQAIRQLLLDAEKDCEVHVNVIANQLDVDARTAGAWMLLQGRGLWTFGKNTNWWRPLVRRPDQA